MYTVKNVKEIIDMIKNGASFAEITEAFGIKQMETVKKWLNNYYTVKKSYVAELYTKLKKNNRRVVQSAITEEATNQQLDTVEETAKEIPEMTAEELANWEAEFFKKDVDYLVDAIRLEKHVVENIVGYLKAHGKTYALSSKKEINIESFVLGGPTIITDNATVRLYCEQDGLKTIHAKAFEGYTCEQQELEWAAEISLPGFKTRTNGGCACNYSEAAEGFAEMHVLETIDIYLDGRTMKGNFCMKAGTTVEYAGMDSHGTTYTWEYELQENGRFKEKKYTAEECRCLASKVIKSA